LWIGSQKEKVEPSNRLQARGPSDARAILDVQSALKRLGGRRQIYVKVLKNFPPECGKAHKTIVRYLDTGNREAASRMAHTVKGTAAAISSVSLSQVAAELETAIRDEGPHIDSLLTIFKSELEQTLEAIDGFLETENKSGVWMI
jgi:HPt (histidine-containing phosphotransfer) domain-containing protein